MLPWFAELLIHPDSFFSSADRTNMNLWIPGIIVLVSGLITVIPLLPALFILRDPATQFMYAIQLIWVLPTPFIGWGIYSVLFYFLGRLFAGSGSFELVARNTGYGMLPGVIVSLIVVIYSSFRGIPILPVAVAGQVIPQSLWVILSVGSLLIVPLIGICWDAYLWIAGVSAAHRIPRKAAGIIVVSVCILRALVLAIPLLFTILIMATSPAW